MSKNIGIINEQGYPLSGPNLGFKPLTEAEKKALKETLDNKNSLNKEK